MWLEPNQSKTFLNVPQSCPLKVSSQKFKEQVLRVWIVHSVWWKHCVNVFRSRPLPTQADLTKDKELSEYEFRVGWRYNAHNIILTVLVHKGATQQEVRQNKACHQMTLSGLSVEMSCWMKARRRQMKNAAHTASAGKRGFLLHTDTIRSEEIHKLPAWVQKPALG